MNSNIVSSTTQTQSIESTEGETYKTFQELCTRYGTKVAKEIRSEKRRLQDELEKSGKPDPPFVKPHPDLPKNEDYTC